MMRPKCHVMWLRFHFKRMLITGLGQQTLPLIQLYNYSRRKYYWCRENANNFWYSIQFLLQYCDIAPQLSLLQLCNSYQSLFFFFCIGFVYWFVASYLYCFPYSFRSSNNCDNNSCRSFMLSKAIAKSNGYLISIAVKSEKEQQLLLQQQLKERKFYREQ